MEHAPDPPKTGSIALLEVLEGLPDATVGATRDGRIVFVNGLAEEQFGYQRDELLGQPIETLWPERVRGRYRRNLDLYFELEHPLRFTERAYGRRKDGSAIIGEMSWGIVNSDDGPLLLAIGRNISERLESESRAPAVRAAGGGGGAGRARAARGRAVRARSRGRRARARGAGRRPRRGARGPARDRRLGRVGRSASSVSVPIHTGDRVHGALVATSPDEEAFGDEEGSFLQAIANVLVPVSRA